MKQLFSFVLLGLIYCTSYAQHFPSNTFYYNYGNNYKRNHVKQYTEKRYDKRKQVYYVATVRTLNTSGRELESVHSNRKGTQTGRFISTYKNDSLYLTSMFIKGNGDTSWKYLYEYDANNNLIKSEAYFGNKCQLQYTDNYTYNTANKRTSFTSTNAKGKITHRYEYDYYDNGDRKEMRFYNHKNRLKQRYTYMCTPKGEIAKTRETNFCSKTQYNADSSYLFIQEKRNEKNEIVRTIWYYSKDQLLTRLETYDKVGALESVTEYSYDAMKNPVVIRNMNDGKLKTTWKKEYAGKDLVSKTSVYNKKDKLIGETTYEYLFY